LEDEFFSNFLPKWSFVKSIPGVVADGLVEPAIDLAGGGQVVDDVGGHAGLEVRLRDELLTVIARVPM
jgi:hypothetical protein